MTPVESFKVQSRPNDNTGLGVDNVVIDANGAVAYNPTHFKQAISATVVNLLHDKVVISKEVLAASVDNHLWQCTEGLWELDSAYYLPTVAGTGGAATVDLKVCGPVVAPSAGVTQLTAGLNLVGTANTKVNGVLITTLTTIGPGSSLAMDFTGTLTSVVGNLTVNLRRKG